MTKDLQSCFARIMSAPEDDIPRRDFADAIRASDPLRSEFIQLQLDLAARRRANRGRGPTSDRQNELLDSHKREWARDLDFYMGETARHRQVELDRGYPWICSMNPYLFLEQGEHIMTNVAPLRGVIFFRDPEGSPFPAKELAASPLLERLDAIRFDEDALDKADFEVLAASPHLHRILSLDIRNIDVDLSIWETIAANPHTQKCLQIRSSFEVPSDHGPLRECSGRFDTGPNRHFEVSAEGRDLERKYGYLPWLHVGNICNETDAHYWLDHEMLPRFVPGSPADKPAPYGGGLWSEPKREPRENFAGAQLDSSW